MSRYIRVEDAIEAAINGCASWNGGYFPSMDDPIKDEFASIEDKCIEMCEDCGMKEILSSVPSAWISVKDLLPDGKRESGEGEYVLATDGVVTTRAFYGYPGGHDEWFINAGEQWEATFDRPVTHWMPLPDTPEVEGCG